MSLPPTGSPATDTSLLNDHGQPCQILIAAEVERQMAPYARDAAGNQAIRRNAKRDVVAAQAAEQAARFGKSADEVRLIDLKAEEAALDYAGHIDRDQRARERQAIRDERREIERRRIQDHLRATLTHPASTVLAAAADTVKHCPNPRAAIESAARNVLWAIENGHEITSGTEWFLSDMQASIAWAQASRTAALEAAE